MRKILFIILFIFGVSSSAHDQLYVAVTSSGSGGSILGHSYLTFCPNSDYLNFSQCESIEYNLDINLGEKFESLKEMSLYDKVKSYFNARFQIFSHLNTKEFHQKYLEREQSITYYQLSASSNLVQSIYVEIKKEQELRNSEPFYDYDLFDNNCATIIMEKINKSQASKGIFFDDTTPFDLESSFYSFPIFLGDLIEESPLFKYSIEISREGWKSKKI